MLTLYKPTNKEMKTRLLLFAIALATAFGVSAQTFTQDNSDGVSIKYTVTTDGYVKVMPNDYNGRVVVPGSVTYEGTTYIVNEVGSSAFYYCDNLSYVQLPASFVKLSGNAFSGSSLDTLDLLCQNPPTTTSGAPYSTENTIKMVFGSNLFKTVTVLVPSGRLAEYRKTAWTYIKNLTSPTAVPLSIGTNPEITLNIVTMDHSATLSVNESSDYYTLNYDSGDTIEFYSQTNQGDYLLLGWDNDDVILGSTGYYMTITQADTIRPIVEIAGYETLSVNNVSTPVKINGLMGYLNGHTEYYVPATSNTSPLYANGLWISGENNHIYASVSRFNCGDFVPGPLRTDGSCQSNLETKRAFNRVWSVSRAEIDDFIAHVGSNGYSIPENILTWPGNGEEGYAEQLAPYYDADSDGIYNPRHGDYPLIRGDRMLFSIFNDVSQHEASTSDPMGLEVHVSAYAFDEPEDTSLNNTVFLSYKVINRSDRTYQNVHFGQFVDFEIGYGYDDYIGCDVQRGLAYCYNGGEIDAQGSASSYSGVPPAQGCVVLGGPTMDADGIDNPLINVVTPNDEKGNNAINGWGFGNGIVDDERIGMRRFVYYENSTNIFSGEPSVSGDYHNYLNGYWKNGEHIKYGGLGYSSSNLDCDFMFPYNSDPLHWGTNGVVPDYYYTDSEWMELLIGNAPGDRRGLVSSGSVTIEPGEENTLDLAFSTGFSPESRMGSLIVLLTMTDDVRRQFNRDTTDSGKPFTYMPYSAPIVGIETAAEQPSVKVYPNPANDRITVALGEGNNTDVDVFDMRGYRVMHVANAKGITTLDITSLPNGIYVVRCGNTATKLMKR